MDTETRLCSTCRREIPPNSPRYETEEGYLLCEPCWEEECDEFEDEEDDDFCSPPDDGLIDW